jgi:hypothetical protein
MRRLAPGLFGSLLLAAVAVAPAARLRAAGLYDGTYHGTLTGAGSNAMACAKQAPVQMTVADNKLEYVHMGHATISATVGADGSFSGSAQNNYAGNRSGVLVQTLDGKISGGAIKALSKVGNSCTYNLELKRF